MVKAVDARLAKMFADAHEERAGQPVREKKMDLHNNAVGREIERIYRRSSDGRIADTCVAALKSGRLRIFIMLVGLSSLARLGKECACRLFVLLLCSSLSVGCSNANADLRQRIGAAVQWRLADARPLRLADVTSFTWDRVAVFPPYTPRALVEQTLGTSVPSEAVAIEGRDDVCLMVFL